MIAKKILAVFFTMIMISAYAQMKVGNRWYYNGFDLEATRDTIISDTACILIRYNDIERKKIDYFLIKNDSNILLFKELNDTKWYFFGYNKLDTVCRLLNVKSGNLATKIKVCGYGERLNLEGKKIITIIFHVDDPQVVSGYDFIEGFGYKSNIFPILVNRKIDPLIYTFYGYQLNNGKCISYHSNFNCPPKKLDYLINIQNTFLSYKNDSTIVNYTVTTPNLSTPIHKSYRVSNDSVYIENCYFESMATSTSTHVEQLNIGTMNKKEYTFVFRVNISDSIDICQPIIYDEKVTNKEILSNVGSNEKLKVSVVYPNPASTKLFLQNVDSENVKILIYNASGTQVISKSILIQSEIDISELPKGLYQLYIKNREILYINSFVKE